MKTSRISLNQMFTLMVLFLTASATLINVGRLSGQNIWIVILIAAVLGSILLFGFHRISYLHGYDSFTNILKDIFGDFIGSIVVLVYTGYFLYMGSRILNSTGNMIQFTLMQDANMLLVMGMLMLVVIYGMILGFNSIGRTSEILFYLVIFSFIPMILGVLTFGIFKVDNLFPILEDGFKSIVPDIYTTTVFPYGELIAFLTIFPLIPKPQTNKILKISYVAVIVGTILLLIVDVFNIGILGPDLAYNFIYPFFNSMKMVGVNVFFERLDPLAIIILMTCCFFKLCIYFYAGVSLLDGLFKKINYRQFTIPVAIIMVGVCTYWHPNQAVNIHQILKVNPKYVLSIFELGIPFLMWLISEIKYHKHPKQKSETN